VAPRAAQALAELGSTDVTGAIRKALAHQRGISRDSPVPETVDLAFALATLGDQEVAGDLRELAVSDQANRSPWLREQLEKALLDLTQQPSRSSR
jgi:hypothetical protein